jgi:hypothetical protein
MKRKFEYTRGTEYKCCVEVDESTGRLAYSNLAIPEDTPVEIKDAFLDEAEIAVLQALDE